MKSFTVIAHRGASGYLPEHTLEGAATAHAMGADFIELDVVLTRDRHLVVMHDLFLEAVTDVAQQFASRRREDGHYYASDFILDEIRSLRVNERRDHTGTAMFPNRFPVNSNIFRIPTLSEMLRLIQGMNASTGKNTGIYVEPKSPAWHEQDGEDIVSELLIALSRHGYQSKSDRAIVQSFDAQSLKRARAELKTELTLVQLIGDNSWAESTTDFDALRSDSGLAEIRGYADGIGPWLPQVAVINPESGQPEITGLVSRAHEQDLFVHAYTLRSDQLPPQLNDFDRLLEFLVKEAKLDGIFTDFPDLAVHLLEKISSASRESA